MSSNVALGNIRGRPRIEIDPEQFEKLCELQCTLNEIAGFFRCSEDTIEKWCVREYGINYTDVYAQKKGTGKIALRRLQWQKAEGKPGIPLRDDNGKVIVDDKGRVAWLEHPIYPDTTMQIWLGKNVLDQADKVDGKGPINDNRQVNIFLNGTKESKQQLDSILAGKIPSLEEPGP